MKKDVENFIRKCDDCQRYKHSRPNVEPMTITTTASCVFEKVFLDIVGPLEVDAQNNRYVLTLQCELSKFVEAYPLQNKEAETVAKSFVNNFILRYGIPSEIVSDRGSEFMNETLDKACKLLKIKKLNSTAYRHQTLGSLENTHKSLNAYLRIQCQNFKTDWSSWLPFWCFCFNNTVHTETKYTPHELVFGRLCNIPSNITQKVDPVYNFDSYPIELKYRLQEACRDARSNLLTSKSNRKLNYDKNCKIVKYNIGDKILLKNEAGNKSEPIYKGPYIVTQINSPNIVIRIGKKFVEVHKNRVKLYYE